MPITISCPACRTKLKAPDNSAGKKVKCPKAECGRIIPVPQPAFEVVEEEPDFEVLEDDLESEEAVNEDPRPKKKRPTRVEFEEEPAPDHRPGSGDDGDPFSPEPYAPDGGFSLVSLPILFLALCLTGICLAGIASFIGQWFYLIVLFPLGIGLGTAFAGYLVVHFTKMRNTVIAAGFGFLSGTVAMVSVHYFDYQLFLVGREVLRDEVKQLKGIPANELTPEQVEEVKLYKEIIKIDGFGDFMHYSATQGVSIGKPGQSSINLGFWGTWIYWIIELVAVACLTTAGLVARSRHPFCTDCEKWKEERPLGTLRMDDDAMEVLKAGDVAALRSYKPASAGGTVALSAYVCSHCRRDASIVVKVERLKPKKGGKKDEMEKKELGQLVYPGEALAAFKAVFPKKPKKVELDEDEA